MGRWPAAIPHNQLVDLLGFCRFKARKPLLLLEADTKCALEVSNSGQCLLCGLQATQGGDAEGLLAELDIFPCKIGD
jgi:hypothetical protein